MVVFRGQIKVYLKSFALFALVVRKTIIANETKGYYYITHNCFVIDTILSVI